MRLGSKMMLNVEVMNEEAGRMPQSVSNNVLRENSDFREFAARMESAGKVYFLRGKNGATRQLTPAAEREENAAGSGSDPEANAREWLECCLRDYLQRKQQFERRCGSRRSVVLRIAAVCVPCFIVLWLLWPLWGVLLDVDAETYYKTLEIPPSASPSEVKRGYREQVRKWHPDRNPSCGEPCRAQMRKIQQAYDVLMERGDQRLELANRYRSELLQVRSIIFFRMYEMASCAAQELFNIVTTVWSGALSDSTVPRVRLASSIITIVFFSVYEVLFVGGFNLIMLLQVFYLLVTMASAVHRDNYISKVRKAAYVDLMREACAMVLPLSVLGAVWVGALSSPSERLEEGFRWAFGCFYLSAYLHRFTPNLYDNLRKRSCTISMNYFSSVMEPVVSLYSVGTAEIGFLIDDLFAFTCRVPSVFRVVVYASHLIYLCQFAMLPWEGPLRPSGTADRRLSTQVEAAETGGAARDSQTAGGAPAPQAPKAARVTALPKSLVGLVADLDADRGNWRRVATAPFTRVMLQAMARYAQSQKVKPMRVDIAPCANFEDVAILVELPDPSAQSSSSKVDRVRYEIIQLVKNPAACRMLALNTGPLGMVPPPGAQSQVSVNRANFATVFGANANMEPSAIWRSRSRPPTPDARSAANAVTSSGVFFACLLSLLACSLLALSISGSLVSPLEAYRASLPSVPKTMQPFAYRRLGRVFGDNHPANTKSAGLATAWRGALTICTIDVWDAYRQLRLYAAKPSNQR